MSAPTERAAAAAGDAAPPPGVRGPAHAYFEGSDEDKARGLFRVLDDQGRADPADVAHLDRALVLRTYRGMLWTRVMDQRFMALQRQGTLGFYALTLGQEAATIASAAAMEPRDWLVPALREHGAGIFRGMDFDGFVAQLFGHAGDVTRGRQMPLHPTDRATNYVNMSSCVASQIPHSVGVAMAMKIAGEGEVCVGYLGDGATSEGDFHVAMNFAGVMKAPVVLVCQNNQWAISTPGSLQTASETLALKGLGYGVESLRADGNDALAVYEVTKYAVDKARRGDGPTFLELLTYRVSAHTSSDDPSRYRDESVTEEWKTRRDPIERMKAFLGARGWLGEADHEAIVAETDAAIRDAIERHRDRPLPDPATLIEDVFERTWWRLEDDFATVR